jgi:hypothetical protein
MRILLVISIILVTFYAEISAQRDFLTLDKLTYEYFLKGDYKNLKVTADSMNLQGIDYYYLRMRTGILAYSNQDYSNAVKNFTKAIGFNSLDTMSHEYIYNSYLFSGRKGDAILYLESIQRDKKNTTLLSVPKPGLSEVFAGSSVSGSDVFTYTSNSLFYEAVKSNLSITAGLETYFSNRVRGTFSFTNFRKSGTEYSPSNPTGITLNYSQNQVYGKLSVTPIQGWELSFFGNLLFYSNTVPVLRQGNTVLQNLNYTEYTGGLGIIKNGWKIRTGGSFSLSNFSNSIQTRGEGFLTYLPSGNLNLYFTTGGMYQFDQTWGGTYQVNGDVGIKISKSLWFETGISRGNSFLYSRNMGSNVNNSLLTPATSVYGNLIILAAKRLSINLTPYYVRNETYSWDLTANSRTDKLTPDSFGGSIKLIYKIK